VLTGHVDDSCAVTGLGHEVSVNVYKDGVTWPTSERALVIVPEGYEPGADGTAALSASGATYSAILASAGPYDIYEHLSSPSRYVSCNVQVLVPASGPATGRVDYYTASFDAQPAGSATGANATAIYTLFCADGATNAYGTIESGTAVLPGGKLDVTATATGAPAYTYTWERASGSYNPTLGVHTQTASWLSLSGTVDDICTVTGTGHEVTLDITRDGSPYLDAPATLALSRDPNLASASDATLATGSGATRFATVGDAATYYVYERTAAGKWLPADVSVEVPTRGPAQASVAYYTVAYSLDATSSAASSVLAATYAKPTTDGSAGYGDIASGDTVLPGGVLTIEAQGVGGFA
jgi:hypothetical protein